MLGKRIMDQWLTDWLSPNVCASVLFSCYPIYPCVWPSALHRLILIHHWNWQFRFHSTLTKCISWNEQRQGVAWRESCRPEMKRDDEERQRERGRGVPGYGASLSWLCEMSNVAARTTVPEVQLPVAAGDSRIAGFQDCRIAGLQDCSVLLPGTISLIYWQGIKCRPGAAPFLLFLLSASIFSRCPGATRPMIKTCWLIRPASVGRTLQPEHS